MVSVAGDDHELSAEDLTLALAPLEGYGLEREGSHAVALELALDDELVRAGRAREIVHAVQQRRRDGGLEITDRIALVLGGNERAARRRARARGLCRRRDARDLDRLRSGARGLAGEHGDRRPDAEDLARAQLKASGPGGLLEPGGASARPGRPGGA